jgi:hypothetical protein
MERRSYRRTTVQMDAEVEISVHPDRDGAFEDKPGATFKGSVQTIDLSLCGLSAKIISSPMDTDRSFSPALAYLLVGKEIKALFPSARLTVWGKVVRFDPKNMLIAVIITRVSDIMLWKNLCSEAIFSCASR